MTNKTQRTERRTDALSKARIVEAAIEILDAGGEDALTFRALSTRLATGSGAIYWHVSDKDDLLAATADYVVARVMAEVIGDEEPREAIRAIALGVFDAIDAHPWVGSALTHAAGQLPMVRIVECLGQQVRALDVPDEEQWAAVSALLHYILGVAGQNAANTQFARTRDLDRSNFLDAIATVWSQLDPNEYPFVRSFAGRLRAHDDRVDFLAGIDLILGGIRSLQIDRIDLT